MNYLHLKHNELGFSAAYVLIFGAFAEPFFCFLLFGMMFYCCIRRRRRHMFTRRYYLHTNYRQDAQIADGRLKLIRKLIDISYTYNQSPELFLEKFKSAVSLVELKKYNIVDFESIYYDSAQGLTQSEHNFCILQDIGFTLREMSVIYNMTNSQSIYIKRYRVMKKLSDINQLLPDPLSK